MSDGSRIEWTDATWNPVSGCTKISPGCKFCYAERLTKRFGLADFSELTLHPDRLALPLRWRAPRRIFVNSMSDLFHEAVPFPFIDDVFRVMREAHQHVFQVLTKRSERLVEWHDSARQRRTVPANVWVGVSVESAAYLWRVEQLRQVEASTRFISAEPLLGPLSGMNLDGISWVITGGESGGTETRSLVRHTRTGLRPTPEAVQWVREIRDTCLRAGVAFFLKQWGGRTAKSGGRQLDGREWSEYPGTRPLKGSGRSSSISSEGRQPLTSSTTPDTKSTP